MRYINTEEVRKRLPAGWESKAQRALDRVRATPEAERPRAVSRRAAVWQALKGILEEISHGKCWYCESIQERSDNVVDHYRPKSRNLNDPDVLGEHQGYWWLAFDWRNYRYSCTYCNSRRTDPTTGKSGGKHDSFPLFNPAQTVLNENADIAREQPMLLDPTVATDPTLLSYEPDGRVSPRYTEEDYPRYFQRARMSIDLYHLDYYKSKERRQVLYNDLKQLVEDGNIYFRRAASGDTTVAHAFEQVVRRLMGVIQPEAEFSAAAMDFLDRLSFESDNSWVRSVFSGS